MTRTAITRGCVPESSRKCTSLAALVRAYIRNYREYRIEGMQFYVHQRSLRDAVDVAAACVLPDGKRHPHQRRIPAKALAEAQRRLLAVDFSGCSSFEDLHDQVEQLVRDIHMIGPLTIYDVAHRIGAYMELEPEFVYLHRGVRTGARALGLGRGRSTLAISELPREMHLLSAAEAEDFLCIYKGDLGRLYRRAG
jgi:hypothetical protein